MRALINGDLVTGKGKHLPGPIIPDDLGKLPLARLRYIDGVLVDAADMTTFFIDDVGSKHAVAGDGFQALDCVWDDILVKNPDGAWRVETDPDRLASARFRAKRRVVAEADRMADIITGEVPRSERDSWSTKAQAARDHQDGATRPWQTDMLQTEADMRGETVDVLAGKIVAAASRYETISAQIAAQRSKTFAAIDAAGTPAEIEQALETAKAEAMAILASIQGG